MCVGVDDVYARGERKALTSLFSGEFGLGLML